MTRRATRRRVVVALAMVGVAVVVAGIVGCVAWRARPEAIGPRFTAAAESAFPGASIDRTIADVPRVQVASGVSVDVRLAPVVATCARRWTACGPAIDGAVADVDLVVAAAAAPRRELLRPVVLAEATPGYRLGYVAETLVQPLELRHALVVGTASTFVTPTIAARLEMTTTELHDAAVVALARDRDAALEPLDGAPGPAPLYRVRAAGDPVASLVDVERLRRFATQLGTRRLYITVPERGVLYVAAGDAAGLETLRARVKRPFGAPPKAGDTGVLACDVDAPDGARWSFPATAP